MFLVPDVFGQREASVLTLVATVSPTGDSVSAPEGTPCSWPFFLLSLMPLFQKKSSCCARAEQTVHGECTRTQPDPENTNIYRGNCQLLRQT